MRPLRKIAIAGGIFVVGLVAALAAIPLLFGDRIAARLRARVDKSVDARVAWSGVGLSLLRGFPNVSMTVNDLSVAGVRAFQGDTLLATRRARLVLDLRSVIGYVRHGRAIVVRELSLERPVVHLRKLADGRANWDIGKSQTTAPSGGTKSVRVSLRQFRLDNAAVTLDDRQSNVVASLNGLDESLQGDFDKERFVLSTRTHVDSTSLVFAGIPYLEHVALDLDANVDADTRAHRFTLTKDTLRLNALVLALGGTVTTGSPNVGLDVTFSTPSAAFAEILSLVPAIYSRDFDKLRTSGTMSVSGQVRGSYGPHAFPALAIRARVDNGAFQYPDLPRAAQDVGLELAVSNPGGNVDGTVIDLKRFHAVVGDRPIDATLRLRTPVSDPEADLRVAGSIDLADVARTVKLPNVSALSGVVAADLSTHARVSDVDARRYDRIAAGGSLQASRVVLRSATIPHPVSIDTAALTLTPRTAQLTAFASKIGGSDVRATGSLDNLIGFVLHDEELRGRAALTSDHVDLNEWKSGTETTEVIPVPAKVDFALDAAAARVTYGPLTLANVKGTVEVRNQRVTMRNLTMGMLGGSMVANGYYETVNPAKPAFNMDVALTTLDIPSAFTTLVSVQKLAPIARYAQGHVSGALSLTGLLGHDMTPVLAALAGKGEISTDALVLRGAPVMQKLSGALSLDRLASPELGALHASIDIADGRLHVKPFKVTVGGVDLTATGSNGIDESLSYDVALAVPRTLLGAAATSTITRLASKSGQLGAQLPAGDVVQLTARVTGTVTNPSVSTNFAGMATSMAEATKAAAQQLAANVAQAGKAKVDSAADAATARARAAADSVVADAARRADTIRAAARAVADSVRKAADARIDSLVAKATNPIARIAARKAADQLRTQAGQQADRLTQAANARADSVLAQARQKAATITSTPR